MRWRINNHLPVLKSQTLVLLSRIKEVKEDEYLNCVASIQVCAMFRVGDIRRNVLLKFMRLCVETPCLCPSEGQKYVDRKLTKKLSSSSP